MKHLKYYKIFENQSQEIDALNEYFYDMIDEDFVLSLSIPENKFAKKEGSSFEYSSYPRKGFDYNSYNIIIKEKSAFKDKYGIEWLDRNIKVQKTLKECILQYQNGESVEVSNIDFSVLGDMQSQYILTVIQGIEEEIDIPNEDASEFVISLKNTLSSYLWNTTFRVKDLSFSVEKDGVIIKCNESITNHKLNTLVKYLNKSLENTQYNINKFPWKFKTRKNAGKYEIDIYDINRR